MKKTLKNVLIVAFAISTLNLVACGSKVAENKTDSEGSTESTVTAEVTIASEITTEEITTEEAIYHSVYSWDREFFDGDPAAVLSEISDYKPTRIYQGLYPADLREPAKTEKTVKALAAEGIEVVYLTGDPDWEDPAVVEEWTIDLLTAYNSLVSEEAQIHSVCFDAEFYAHEGWDNEEHFRDYTKMMKSVIEYTHEKGFKFILSAPYWLTDFSEEVYADLIAAADELSCMIYLVGQEEEKLESIYQMCKDGNTKFEIILETQEVSEEYGVSEYNTYRCHGGKTAVLAAAQRLQEEYPDISIGFHSLKFMLTLE